MSTYNVSVYCHGMVTVQAGSEREALEKASKASHDQVSWEDGYNDMEAFLDTTAENVETSD